MLICGFNLIKSINTSFMHFSAEPIQQIVSGSLATEVTAFLPIESGDREKKINQSWINF